MATKTRCKHCDDQYQHEGTYCPIVAEVLYEALEALIVSVDKERDDEIAEGSKHDPDCPVCKATTIARKALVFAKKEG